MTTIEHICTWSYVASHMCDPYTDTTLSSANEALTATLTIVCYYKGVFLLGRAGVHRAENTTPCTLQ